MNSYMEIIRELIEIESEETVVIWGAGIRGKRVAESLNTVKSIIGNWKSTYYCDIDPKKQGNVIDGILCLLPEDLESMDNLVIIVSMEDSQDFCDQLRCKFSGKARVFGTEFVALLDILPIAHGYVDFIPLGHYYSLYPEVSKIKKRKNLYGNTDKTQAINYREEEQLKLLNKMLPLYHSAPDWKSNCKPQENTLRYQLQNDAYPVGDALTLNCLLRLVKPKRMIEIGCGWSSAVTLDTNEFYLDSQIDLTFIEPYPDRLHSILKNSDKIHLIEQDLQEVPLETFRELREGDVLFIDSSHVSKIGSDVNYLFYEILPMLHEGVYIHFHDILYSFEYPEEWLEKGICWNEAYILKAFLMYNDSFEIVFFQNMMAQKYGDQMGESWPFSDFSQDVDGGSIWLRKVR